MAAFTDEDREWNSLFLANYSACIRHPILFDIILIINFNGMFFLAFMFHKTKN